MADDNKYIVPSYDMIMSERDFQQIKQQLTPTQYDALYGQYDAYANQLANAYSTGIKNIESSYGGQAYSAIQNRRNVAGATGALGQDRYAAAVRTQYAAQRDSAKTKLAENTASATAALAKEVSDYDAYLGQNISKLNRFMFSQIDRSVFSEDDTGYNTLSPQLLQAQGYVTRNKDGSYTVTDKWRDAWAKFFTGAKGNEDVDPRTYESALYNEDRDLYDFYNQYNWLAVQGGAQIGEDEYKKLQESSSYAGEYLKSAEQDVIDRIASDFDSTQGTTVKSAYKSAIDKPDITTMSSKEIAEWANTVNTQTGYAKGEIDGYTVSADKVVGTDRRIKSKTIDTWYAQGTKINVGGNSYKLTDDAPSEIDGKRELGDVAVTITGGQTEKLGTLVNQGKIDAGDTFKYGDDYYIVVRADSDPDKLGKGGKHAADVRAIKLKRI